MRSLFPFLLILLLTGRGLAVPFGIPTTAPASAEAQFHKGEASFAEGSLDKAAAAFTETLRLDPTFVRAIVGLADIARAQRKVSEADKYLQRALAMAPNDAEVQTAMGRFLYTQGNFKEAEAHFRKAIQLNPQLVAPYVDLGDLYQMALGRLDDAIQAYRDAVAVDPTHAGAHFALGMALTRSGQADEARSHLEEASSLAPENPLPLQVIGDLHAARGEYDMALEAYKAALAIQPDFLKVQLAMGDVLEAKGEDAEALAAYQEALEIHPGFAPALVKIGMVHHQNHRFREAEEAYRKAIQQDANQAIAYNNLAAIAIERGNPPEESVQWARTAVKLVPDSPQFQDTLGWLYYARGSIKEAASVLGKAAASQPPQAAILYHLGVVYHEMGRTKEASQVLEHALALGQPFAGAEDARQRLAQLRRP